MKGLHRKRRVSPTAISLIDPTVPEPYSADEMRRAQVVLRSLDLAAFAKVDEDRTVMLAVEALRGKS